MNEVYVDDPTLGRLGETPAFAPPLAALLRATRQRKGLTQHALAQAVGCSDMAVRRWEAGTGTPGLRYARKLCAALGLGMRHLLAAAEAQARGEGRIHDD